MIEKVCTRIKRKIQGHTVPFLFLSFSISLCILVSQIVFVLPALVISFLIGTIYESKRCGKTHLGICYLEKKWVEFGIIRFVSIQGIHLSDFTGIEGEILYLNSPPQPTTHSRRLL